MRGDVSGSAFNQRYVPAFPCFVRMVKQRPINIRHLFNFALVRRESVLRSLCRAQHGLFGADGRNPGLRARRRPRAPAAPGGAEAARRGPLAAGGGRLWGRRCGAGSGCPVPRFSFCPCTRFLNHLPFSPLLRLHSASPLWQWVKCCRRTMCPRLKVILKKRGWNTAWF